jgi:putative addiction module component (TIGR02574 family)
MNAESIEHEALKLPVLARAALAHKLLESLDAPSEAEADASWLNEAERRASEIDSGAVPLVPSDEVSRKARTLLG